jgi:hypothetical protein
MTCGTCKGRNLMLSDVGDAYEKQKRLNIVEFIGAIAPSGVVSRGCSRP